MLKQIILGFVITIFILLGIIYGCAHYFFGNMCGNQIVSEVISPDSKYKAVVFIQDCGATTGFSTQLSIIESSDTLQNELGNILRMNDKTGEGLTFDNGAAKVKVVWNGNDELKVSLDLRTEISKQKNRFQGIKISYNQL